MSRHRFHIQCQHLKYQYRTLYSQQWVKKIIRKQIAGMLTRTYFFCLMIFSIVFQRTIQNGVHLDYAVRTHSLPTTTCLRVNDVKSTWRCFSTCLKKMNYFYMFSHNNPDQSCACCTDQTGSALTGTKWKTYIPRKYWSIFIGSFHKFKIWYQFIADWIAW